MQGNATNRWLFGRRTDLLVLFAPVWAIWLVCWLLPGATLQHEVPIWVWVVFVLGIDVSHVWSTIFRTYGDKEEFGRHRRLLVAAPLLCFVALFALAQFTELWYWRILAYLALFHFIKQQYGFLALYAARFGWRPKVQWLKDKWVVYLATLYPVVYWHLNSNLNFNWFVAGDFFSLPSLMGLTVEQWQQVSGPWFVVANVLYWCVIAAWGAETVWRHRRSHQPPPIGKLLWVGSTAMNWYMGIVWFNSDLVFTLTNVVAHGLPYMALVFHYVEGKKAKATGWQPYRKVAGHVAWMVTAVLLLAFGEELLWDVLLNHEKQAFFGQLISYPAQALANPWWQALVLALLSLPQVTHYVLDGFIWRVKSNPHVKTVLIRPPQQ